MHNTSLREESNQIMFYIRSHQSIYVLNRHPDIYAGICIPVLYRILNFIFSSCSSKLLYFYLFLCCIHCAAPGSGCLPVTYLWSDIELHVCCSIYCYVNLCASRLSLSPLTFHLDICTLYSLCIAGFNGYFLLLPEFL